MVPEMSHSSWLALDVPQFVGASYFPHVLWLPEPGGAQGTAGHLRPDWIPLRPGHGALM